MAGMVEQKKLEEEGWVRRNLVSEPRLSELVELYEAVGMEVLTVSANSLVVEGAQEPECGVCLTGGADPDVFKVIFTRPADGKPAD